jgi:hypothetical protein
MYMGGKVTTNCSRRSQMRSEGSVARVTEIVADSTKSFEDAVMTGFKRASKNIAGNHRGAYKRSIWPGTGGGDPEIPRYTGYNLRS